VCCLALIAAGLGPRIAFFFWWVFGDKVDLAYDTWIWPLLGLLFLPFAPLMYVILWTAGGLSGWDWFWVVLAALLDIGHWGAGAAQRRTASTT